MVDRPDEPAALVVIAAVARPHGLRGALRVKLFNPESETLAAGQVLTVTQAAAAPRTVRVATAQAAGDTWLVELEGVASREAAEALRGAELAIPRRSLPPLEEGEFYHADIVGFAVRDAAGDAVGTVREVLAYPSVDALVVATREGTLEVPIVDGIVLGIDAAAKVVTVDRAALHAE